MAVLLVLCSSIALAQTQEQPAPAPTAKPATMTGLAVTPAKATLSLTKAPNTTFKVVAYYSDGTTQTIWTVAKPSYGCKCFAPVAAEGFTLSADGFASATPTKDPAAPTSHKIAANYNGFAASGMVYLAP